MFLFPFSPSDGIENYDIDLKTILKTIQYEFINVLSCVWNNIFRTCLYPIYLVEINKY